MRIIIYTLSNIYEIYREETKLFRDSEMFSSRPCLQNSCQLSASESGIQAPSQLNGKLILELPILIRTLT